MTLPELKKIFYQQIQPARPNDWEVEELLEAMVELGAEQQLDLMSFVSAVWPVSHSLCFSYLEYGAEYIHHLRRDELGEWVRQLLGWYEKDGLRGARLFMAEAVVGQSGNSVRAAGIRLEEVRGKLLPFIRGVSGTQLELAPGGCAWTDTETIFLPEMINLFPDPSANERFFTFLTCCQWGYIVLGTLHTEHDAMAVGGIEEFFARFSDPVLAENIFHYLEFSRVYRLLCTELPGLMRSVRPLLEYLIAGDGGSGIAAGTGCFVPLLRSLLKSKGAATPSGGDWVSGDSASREESCRQVADLYLRMSDGRENDWPRYECFAGRLLFAKVRERQARRRLEEEKHVFVQQLAVVIGAAKTADVHNDGRATATPAESGDGKQLRVALTCKDGEHSPEFTLKVNSVEVDLTPELLELLKQMQTDLGHIPEGYVQAAAGIAGRAVFSGAGGADGNQLLQNAGDAILYDEWDYRRQGYRKDWCSLIEKDVQPVRSRFVENTLERHRGLIVRLRRQFESLRTQHRFTRRRRYGDDIDFDALVDAVGDRKAGLAPSERLFIRLLRDERDIAVMFLVDMSNSTEGWVGKAIKESLVLLGDVLEVVGDRYGIYGFSGMRRSRCELYRVKRIDEPYSERVQQRICAISPREYTRMAPPLRHLTKMLIKTDARVRLLIIISDGKPEDYDDYKGEYAIEDTRQALIEARGKGVIPFCITVDQEPHAYLPHMFGQGSYIHVDNVEQLPRRMPEIYRLLTS